MGTLAIYVVASFLLSDGYCREHITYCLHYFLFITGGKKTNKQKKKYSVLKLKNVLGFVNTVCEKMILYPYLIFQNFQEYSIKTDLGCEKSYSFRNTLFHFK